MEKLDRADLAILCEMQKNSRLTIKELAARIGLSSTPVFERLKRLEAEGYILKYQAILNAEKLNGGFTVFCNVKLKSISREIEREFVSKIGELAEVTECYNISGAFDYLLKVNVPDMKYYREFLLNTLGTLEVVDSVESTFVMAEVKHSHGINVVRIP